jgi:hypothetical protein
MRNHANQPVQAFLLLLLPLLLPASHHPHQPDCVCDQMQEVSTLRWHGCSTERNTSSGCSNTNGTSLHQQHGAGTQHT